MAVNSPSHCAAQLSRCLRTRSSFCFSNRTFSKTRFFTEAPTPRLVSVRSQKPGPDGFRSRPSTSLEESEASIEPSASSSVVDFLTLCHRLKVYTQNFLLLILVWLPRKKIMGKKMIETQNNIFYTCWALEKNRIEVRFCFSDQCGKIYEFFEFNWVWSLCLD